MRVLIFVCCPQALCLQTYMELKASFCVFIINKTIIENMAYTFVMFHSLIMSLLRYNMSVAFG